jgi:hypothetical protein
VLSQCLGRPEQHGHVRGVSSYQGWWGLGASQWSMDDRSLVMSDWQRVLDWLLT